MPLHRATRFVVAASTAFAGACAPATPVPSAPTPAPAAAPQAPRPAVTGYATPPAPIADILNAAPLPGVAVSPDGSRIVFLDRAGMPSIEELAEPELRLAGTRINPRTSGPSRSGFTTGIRIAAVEGGREIGIQAPEGARISWVQWSPDGRSIAFSNTLADGIELWVADVATGAARRVLGAELNGTLGSPFQWTSDGRSLLVKRVVPGRGPEPVAAASTGPVIQESAGSGDPVRTFQDLLTNPHDEALFEHYFTSQLAIVPAAGGAATPLGEAGIYASIDMAPGGEYVLARRVKRPFSYIAPLWSFANETVVMDRRGATVARLDDNSEVTFSPIGRDMVNPGRRSISWRADAPATLVWVEAMDGGDARSDAAVRDRVFLLDAPFSGTPRTLIDLDQRFAGIHWGRDDLALVHSRWTTNARTRTMVIDPSRPGAAPRVLVDRSAESRYDDPGSPVTTLNASGHRVLRFSADGTSIFLAGQGASPQGDYPFLDRLQLSSGNAERLWQAEDPYHESFVALTDDTGTRFITRRESLDEAPNYFLRDLGTGQARALTDFRDPAPQLAGVQRQIITYPREDGVMLSATLLTPPGYDAERDGPLPTLLWAYPREFRDAAAASQIIGSANRFSRPGGASHLFLLTQGYAILDGPAMPIIGEGDEEPNDRYIEQLVSSARAVVEKGVEMGVVDRDRIGVGGHSYGAFMTANLLAHSDLFRAGIARSGAYNRTLTPFGFQAERRTYWEAPEVYLGMSPFNYANRINEPILLIHGEADNNSGTFPMQSERMYQALVGHGATVRYVVLPHESHGYAARESVMHTVAEMVEWMDRWVKGTGSAAAGR
jgi:dipeptidyl aminopeptidase/acylaminoacyl peptidase